MADEYEALRDRLRHYGEPPDVTAADAIDALLKERAALLSQHAAWTRAFGTTQLTHALARLDALIAQVRALTRERDELTEELARSVQRRLADATRAPWLVCSICAGLPEETEDGCICGDGSHEGEVRALRLSAIEGQAARAELEEIGDCALDLAKARAELERLTRERDEARAVGNELLQERIADRAVKASLLKDVAELERLRAAVEKCATDIAHSAGVNSFPFSEMVRATLNGPAVLSQARSADLPSDAEKAGGGT